MSALRALAEQLRAEDTPISPHVVDPGEESAFAPPGEYAIVLEAVREGYLLHYGEPRLLAGHDADLALLVISVYCPADDPRPDPPPNARRKLSDADIEKMVKEAEQNAEADKRKREAVEAKNQAESLIHSTEKSLKDYGDKVGADDKAAIETAVTELRAVLDGDNAELIGEKTEALAQASMKLGEAMYQASQAEAASGGEETGEAQSGGEDVVDAEFEEVPEEEQNRKKSA